MEEIGEADSTNAPTPDSQSEAPELLSQSDEVAVPDWQDLSAKDTLPITLQRPVTVVLPIGRVGCGKTTLITTIYDQFQLGPFSGWIFAGSDTLLGFERRSWTSRTESGRQVADSERTKVRAGERFLHLRVQDEGQERASLDVLVVDASGELYQRLVDYPDAPPDIVSLKRADIVSMLVDGEELADPKRRHSVLHDGRMLCRAITEKEFVRPEARLQVVVTKWDLIDAAGISRDDLVDEVNRTILKGLGESRVARVLVTAARPGPLKVPWAFGCASLLDSWLEPPAVAKPIVYSAPISERQFDAFGRTAGSLAP